MQEKLVSIEREKQEMAQEFQSKLQSMISIAEHEQILNTEINKVNQGAQQKLNEIQSAMDA